MQKRPLLQLLRVIISTPLLIWQGILQTLKNIYLILESNIFFFLHLNTLKFPPMRLYFDTNVLHILERGGAHVHAIQHYGQRQTRRTFEQHLIPHVSQQIRKW